MSRDWHTDLIPCGRTQPCQWWELHQRSRAGWIFLFRRRRSSYTLFQHKLEQVAQLSQRDRAAGWVSYGQKWKTGTGRQYYYIIFCRSIFNHCGVIGQQSNRIRWKKRKIRAITAFKVIQGIEIGINRKPVCDFLLMINSNRHPLSYRFGVIAACCSNIEHFAFLSRLRGA